MGPSEGQSVEKAASDESVTPRSILKRRRLSHGEEGSAKKKNVRFQLPEGYEAERLLRSPSRIRRRKRKGHSDASSRSGATSLLPQSRSPIRRKRNGSHQQGFNTLSAKIQLEVNHRHRYNHHRRSSFGPADISNPGSVLSISHSAGKHYAPVGSPARSTPSGPSHSRLPKRPRNHSRMSRIQKLLRMNNQKCVSREISLDDGNAHKSIALDMSHLSSFVNKVDFSQMCFQVQSLITAERGRWLSDKKMITKSLATFGQELVAWCQDVERQFVECQQRAANSNEAAKQAGKAAIKASKAAADMQSRCHEAEGKVLAAEKKTMEAENTAIESRNLVEIAKKQMANMQAKVDATKSSAAKRIERMTSRKAVAEARAVFWENRLTKLVHGARKHKHDACTQAKRASQLEKECNKLTDIIDRAIAERRYEEVKAASIRQLYMLERAKSDKLSTALNTSECKAKHILETLEEIKARLDSQEEELSQVTCEAEQMSTELSRVRERLAKSEARGNDLARILAESAQTQGPEMENAYTQTTTTKSTNQSTEANPVPPTAHIVPPTNLINPADIRSDSLDSVFPVAGCKSKVDPSSTTPAFAPPKRVIPKKFRIRGSRGCRLLHRIRQKKLNRLPVKSVSTEKSIEAKSVQLNDVPPNTAAESLPTVQNQMEATFSIPVGITRARGAQEAINRAAIATGMTPDEIARFPGSPPGFETTPKPKGPARTFTGGAVEFPLSPQKPIPA